MEVSIGEYGRMMFEMMNEGRSNLPPHWESIRDEAKPLVAKLIALNDKMNSGGYEIIGLKKNGKKVLSKTQRIAAAQRRLWEEKATGLKEGDKIWLLDDSDHEMYIGQDEPVPVIDISRKGIYLEMPGCNDEYIHSICKEEKILKAPRDFNEKQDLYESDEYWLKQADELGI